MIGLRVVWRILYTLHRQICDKKSALRSAKSLKISRDNEIKQIRYLTHNHQNVCLAFCV